MKRGQSNEFRRILNERVNEIGKCELCGSKRDLELHHIIPYSLFKHDAEDNLILVCKSCHTKLTPTSTLTKLGQMKNRYSVVDAIDFYNDIKELDTRCDTIDVMDIFDRHILRLGDYIQIKAKGMHK